jgi:hypothetical protein
MEVPPELSDAQIKAMSEPELRLALTKISEAKKYLPKDDPQQERLQREFRAIIDQLKVVRAAAS